MATAKKSKAKLRKSNKLGYNGVVKLANGKFVGQSWFDKKNHVTEQFKTPVEAAKAYDEMTSKAHADGKLKRLNLNFPNSK